MMRTVRSWGALAATAADLRLGQHLGTRRSEFGAAASAWRRKRPERRHLRGGHGLLGGRLVTSGRQPAVQRDLPLERRGFVTGASACKQPAKRQLLVGEPVHRDRQCRIRSQWRLPPGDDAVERGHVGLSGDVRFFRHRGLFGVLPVCDGLLGSRRRFARATVTRASLDWQQLEAGQYACPGRKVWDSA
jgi:hypothetical protein